MKPKPTAVVVDDVEAVGQVSCRLLDKLGYQTTLFQNPIEALGYLGACGRLDVLLTDHDMPEIAGLQMARRAKEANPDIRQIIIVCGMVDDLMPERASLCGFEFLEKPFRAHELARKIKP